MTCTKVRQASGSWSLELVPDAPVEITNLVNPQVNAFAHVCILPSRIDVRAVSSFDVFSLSIFTGVLYKREARRRISGHHVNSWVGDPNDIGQVINGAANPDTRTFKSWIETWRPPTLGIGNVENVAPALQYSGNPNYQLVKDMYDWVCTFYGDATGNPTIEWDVSEAVAINAGTVEWMYGASPVAFLAPDLDGSDPDLPGIPASFVPVNDVDDYITDAIAQGGSSPLAHLFGTRHYRDVFNALITRERFETFSPWVDVGTASTLHAQRMLQENNTWRRQITAHTNQSAILRDIKVGQLVYGWDPPAGIWTPFSDTVYFRGEATWPLLDRVSQITMPVEEGMAVILRLADGTMHDLTDWIVPESPGATINLGAVDRRL